MKTFLLDLHGGLSRLGPAAPLLYPYRAEGELEVMLEAAGRDLRELADAVRASLLRDYRPRTQVVFVIDLAAGGLVEQTGRIRAEFLGHLAGRGIVPARVVVVAVDALGREPHTGIPEEAAARAAWERDAQALSAGAAPVEGMLVLRFPLQRTPEPVFQQHLVHLAYLLAVVTELEDGDEVRRERLYTVDAVALDPAETGAWMAEHERALAHAQREVERAIQHPEPVELALIEDANCGCSRVLDPLEVGQKTYGWLRGPDDFAGWRGWWQETGRRLAAHAKAGEEVVQGCMKEWRGRAFETTPRTVDSTADHAAQVRERLHAARRALAGTQHPRRDEPDWEAEMARATLRVHALLEARPRPQAFFVFTAFLIPLLVLPVLLTLPRDPAGDVAAAVLVLAGGAGAAAWVLRRLSGRLHLETHRAQTRGREVSSGVQQQVDRRKRHLAALCAVEVARRNDAVAQEAARAFGERMRLLKFHQRELAAHRDRAGKFARACAPGRPASPAPAPAADEAPPAAAPLRIEQPPHLNAVYAPALAAGIPRERPYEVRVRSGAMVIRRASTRLRGLLHVQLGDDIIYRPVQGGPPGAPAAEPE